MVNMVFVFLTVDFFLKKLIGTIGFANTDLLEDQFRTDVIEAVRVTIAKFMKENDVNVNELGSEYKALSKSNLEKPSAIFRSMNTVSNCLTSISKISVLTRMTKAIRLLWKVLQNRRN